MDADLADLAIQAKPDTARLGHLLLVNGFASLGVSCEQQQ